MNRNIQETTDVKLRQKPSSYLNHGPEVEVDSNKSSKLLGLIQIDYQTTKLAIELRPLSFKFR